YSQVFREYSAVDECIEHFQAPGAPRLRTICVLGAGTGQVLRIFRKRLHRTPYGCEFSPWAFTRIPRALRARIELRDMRDYIQECPRFDLIFSNSLMYLRPAEIEPFLITAGKKCRYFHYEGSFLGNACRDSYRRTLRSEAWWNTRFMNAGFRQVAGLWGQPTYLWKFV
ncbi:MAG: class I SAM-dependent methyltransferase, partial [Bacteriovoracia bacterium]